MIQRYLIFPMWAGFGPGHALERAERAANEIAVGICRRFNLHVVGRPELRPSQAHPEGTAMVATVRYEAR